MCEPTNHSHKPSNKPTCNCCGQPIQIVTESGIYRDHLKLTKKWGYFSNKDLSMHSLVICEACYDKWIQTFAIEVEKQVVTEVFDGIE